MSAELERAARSLATALRNTADEIERHAHPKRDLLDLHPDHTGAAAEIVHDVTTLIGNLRLHELVQLAAKLDKEARSGA